MKRFFLSVVLILTMISCAMIISNKDNMYDNNLINVNKNYMDLNKIYNSLYLVKTVTKFKYVTDEKKKEFGTEDIVTIGITVALNDKTLLTVDHIVTEYKLTFETPFGIISIPADKLEEKSYLLLDGKEYLLNRLFNEGNIDVALLGVVGDLRLNSYPYKIGNSDDLEIGNFVYVFGNPLSWGINLRSGIISSLDLHKDVAKIADVNEKNAFVINAGLIPGDSGGVAIAIRDGEFELVGLLQGTHAGFNNMSWVIKINVIMDAINDYYSSV